MLKIIRNSLRLAIWLFLPFVFTSYISPNAETVKTDSIIGSYHLSTSGNQSMALQGSIVFSTAIDFPTNGKPYSTINLELRNNENENSHSMGFLISKQNWDKELKRGKYKVPVKIHGFIKDFEGVFGFANFQEMGEIPFFTQKGKIEISHIGQKLLHGELELSLENADGNQLNIVGEFTATRRL